MQENYRSDYWKVALLGALFFVPFLGGVHLFDWDEINFAECAREMLLSGDYMRPQIDFQPFWEKPPLFLWMQVFSMKLFGVNEFAARFPNALCGIATVVMSYHIGRHLHDRAFGWLWVMAWMGSILPHLYFRSGIIDPWFNFFIFAGLYGFIAFRWQFFTQKAYPGFWKYYKPLLLGGVSLGLAILSKGPTAYLIAFLVLFLYFAKYRFSNRRYIRHFIYFSLAAASVSLLWFGVETALHGSWFVTEFVMYQIRLLITPDSGHGGFWGYHFVVLLLGAFPISLLAIPNLWGDRQTQDEVLESDTLMVCKRSDFATWMQLLFWVVLILFSLVRTKIVHYSSLAYFPLSYLGALTLWRAWRWSGTMRLSAVLVGIFGLLIGAVVAFTPIVGSHLEWIKPLFERDAFALGNLEANVHWHVWQGLPGVILALGSVIAAYLLYRQKIWLGAQLLFASGALFVAFTLIFFINNIEDYSQHAAIEFYKNKASEPCYIKPVGFKSYAHLFYARKPMPNALNAPTRFEELMQATDKKVYFVAKQNRLEELTKKEGIHELYRKNGFVFFEKR